MGGPVGDIRRKGAGRAGEGFVAGLRVAVPLAVMVAQLPVTRPGKVDVTLVGGDHRSSVLQGGGAFQHGHLPLRLGNGHCPRPPALGPVNDAHMAEGFGLLQRFSGVEQARLLEA